MKEWLLATLNDEQMYRLVRLEKRAKGIESKGPQ